MKRTLVAVACSLLVSVPALADESPATNASAESVASARAPAATGDATATTTSARTDRAAVRKNRRVSADDAANKSVASQVKQLELKALNDGTVCRTEYPTGSRIGVKRCSSTTETAGSKVQNEIMQRDLQEMRDRQVYEQLRRASVAMTPTMQGSPSR